MEAYPLGDRENKKTTYIDGRLDAEVTNESLGVHRLHIWV